MRKVFLGEGTLRNVLLGDIPYTGTVHILPNSQFFGRCVEIIESWGHCGGISGIRMSNSMILFRQEGRLMSCPVEPQEVHKAKINTEKRIGECLLLVH